MIKKRGNKFTTDYKNFIKQIFEKEGFQKAYETVKADFNNIQITTIKKWVDSEYNKRKQNISKKAYNKWKTNNPEAYEKQSSQRREHQRTKLQEDQEYKERQYCRTMQWREQHKDYHKNYSKVYWKQFKEKQLFGRRRHQSDLGYRILENTRAYLHQLLKKAYKHNNFKKKETTISLIGCSISELLKHLRSFYQPGMTDENYGEWEIDHIKPCSLFNLKDPEERKKCFHFTNLQPLWAADNRKKSNLYEEL